MNPLQSRLAALRRRLRLVVSVRGLCLTGAVLLAGLLFAGFFDWLVYYGSRVLNLRPLETWSLVRAGLLVGTLAVTGAVAWFLLIRPLTTRTDDLSLALRVEERYPHLNDALASTVQFLEQTGDTNPGTSPALEKEAVQRALRLAQGCNFFTAVNHRGIILSVVGFALFLGTCVALLALAPPARTAFVRFTDPFGDHSWVAAGTQTQLAVHYPRNLAIGQPLAITGEVRGKIPDPAKATIEFEDISMPPRQVDIKLLSESHGTFVASNIKIPSHSREVRFRVRAGDAVSPPQSGAWHSIALRLPPQLASLNGKPSPQITIRQPRYTELPEFVTLPDGVGNLDVVAGSQVTLRAATDQPLDKAWIEFKPMLPGAREALLAAAMGHTHPVDAAATTALTQTAWGRIPATIDKTGKQFVVHFVPGLTGAYVLTIQDKDGLSKSYEFDLNVRPDPVPVVTILRPSSSQSVLANAEITLQIQADDEIYALRTVYLEYRRKDKNGQWIDAEPKRILYYDHAKAETGLPLFMTTFAAAPAPLPTKSLHLRPKRLVVTQRFSLKGLALEGQTIVLQACAEDFNDVVPFPQPGRSPEVELRVVPKTQLAAVLDEQEAAIQQQLLKLKDMQEKAIKKVIGAEEQLKATGKLRPEDLIELAEAEQIQNEIKNRIGTKKDEGLRGELAQIEEMLKDNKLPKSEIAERMKNIREELERISRENLPKIDPGLTKARRDPDELAEKIRKTQEEVEKAKKIPDAGQREATLKKLDDELRGLQKEADQNARDLGDARAEQEKVQEAIADLLKDLEERSTFQQLKAELRDILKEEQERQKDVEKLLEEVDKANGNTNVLRQPDLKAQLRRTAELQRRLADRTEKLIDALGKLSKQKADKDPGLAEMLDRAAKIGTSDQVPSAMRAIARLLKDDFDQPKGFKRKPGEDPFHPHLAHSNQENVIGSLEKMLEALDQTRADEVERLIVKQKKEEKNLDDLAEKIRKVQDELEKARKIADPKQRDAALKKLGDELRGLQKEAEQNARDLGNAQAKDAAKDVKDAVNKLERVLRQLERGEEPDDALKQARDKIDAAKDKLKEAREQAEEELAREQIAKIVDRLKGLKERQDAAVAETERLRKDFLLHQNWVKGKVASLADQREAQKGLAGETVFLRDKLKGAKVFFEILDRAQKDMRQAEDKLDKWALKAAQHQSPKVLKQPDLDEEKTAYEVTIKFQKSASDRLQRLIDALLPELDPPQPIDPKNDDGKGGKDGGKNGGGDNQPKKGGLKAQDGIPPVAQLKALRAEQLEINARTKEFAERHPNFDQLTPPERAELDAIRAEQDRLLQLFRDMIISGKGEGGKQ
jgi:hypothetical protein